MANPTVQATDDAQASPRRGMSAHFITGWSTRSTVNRAQRILTFLDEGRQSNIAQIDITDDLDNDDDRP
jgi:hypothetical protein